MTIENIGEKEYIDAVKGADQIWVLMQDGSTYTLKSENGISVPNWHSKEKADDFIKEASLNDMSAVSVSIASFIAAWLETKEMNIVSIIATPKFGLPGLTYTNSEYVGVFKT